MSVANPVWRWVLVSALLLVPVAVQGTTYTVNADGTGDFPTIQAAIDAAVDGDIIELTDGIFSGEGNRDVSFGGKPITLRSQMLSPESCIIDCQAGAENQHRGFYFSSSDGPSAELAGITIRNGFSQSGAGIYCVYGASPTISACVIASNIAVADGGGLYNRDGASPTVSDCIFQANAAINGGGVYCDSDSRPNMNDCVFIENSAVDEGGGMYFRNGSYPNLDRCDFTGNFAGGSGGGLLCRGNSSLLINECRFVQNEAGEGGGGMACIHNCLPVLEDCVFLSNSATDGGAISITAQSSPLIIGGTFIDNHATNRGGAYFCSDVSGGSWFHTCTIVGNSAGSGGGLWIQTYGWPDHLRNTIVAFSDQGEAIYTAGNTPGPTMNCCDLYGNEGGDWTGGIADQYGINGNISEDPLFCSPPGDILTLHSDSPCAEENNPECGYIGAWPVGCGESTSVKGGRSGVGWATRIFPNPTPGPITIDFTLPTSGWISARILDVSGRLVRDLFNGTYPHVYAGDFSLTWDGRDDAGRRVASGGYVARVEGPGGRSTSRVVVAR